MTEIQDQTRYLLVDTQMKTTQILVTSVQY